MHDGEINDLYAPFGAFPGASSHKNHPIGTVDDNNNNNGNATASGVTLAGGAQDKKGEISIGGSEPQQLDNVEFNGGDNEDIADNVDGFLDDFLALVDDSVPGEGMDDMMDMDGNGGGNGNGNGNGDVAEEELVWLEDMDLAAFLPPPAATDALAAANNPLPLPLSSHEIELVPAAAVVEDSAPAAPVEEPSPRSGAEAWSAVDISATDGASPSSAGLSAPVVAAAAASAAPAFVVGGGAGRNGNDGGAGGGGGGVDAVGVSRKEQVRRQKVARYLAKKKSRRWSKATASSYQSRQRVANSRPRHKGRFLPLESDFVSIEELQRRQRAQMKQIQERMAAARAAAPVTSEAPTFALAGAAATGNESPLSLGFGNQVAI